MDGGWERQTVQSSIMYANILSLISDAGRQLDDESLRTFTYKAMAIVSGRHLTVENLTPN